MSDLKFVITKTRTNVETGTDGKKAVVFNIQYRDGSTNAVILDTCANLIDFLSVQKDVFLFSMGTTA